MRTDKEADLRAWNAICEAVTTSLEWGVVDRDCLPEAFHFDLFSGELGASTCRVISVPDRDYSCGCRTAGGFAVCVFCQTYTSTQVAVCVATVLHTWDLVAEIVDEVEEAVEAGDFHAAPNRRFN